MHSRTPPTVACGLLLPALSFLLLCPPCRPQSPPPHPRLLFTSAEIPALLARTGVSGTRPATSWAACSTSATLQTAGSLPSVSNQSAWVVQRSLRRMQEVAFRYRLTGDAVAGNNARSLLMSLVSLLTPTGTSAYQMSSYAAAMALTYDMVHPLLTATERTSVINHLLAWVAAMQTGVSGGGLYNYASYSGCTDNFSFAWCTGISLCLMAVWGDVTYPNIVPTIQQNLVKLQSGWRDVFSPDGSVDEGVGYANYGELYSILAGTAAIRCGLGDYMQGTNLLGAGRWMGTALLGNSFAWAGDSGPTHKGMRIDPVVYYTIQRTGDAEALWAIERVFNIEPPSDNTASFAFSPHINTILFHPTTLAPQIPQVFSSFFRDNLNQGTPESNRTTNYFEVGTGGHAFLHNQPTAGWLQFGAYYNIRDEWMNHAHEDDGHLSVVSEGVHQYLDIGYAQSNFAGAQTQDHNIVLVTGQSGFGGDYNNYYNPPAPGGRFLGRREASLLSPGADYVRGNHANMWMMQEAHRTVVLIKDATRPCLILLDRVNKDGQSRTYEEIFHSAGPATGGGTAASPMTVTSAGRTLRATWLSPSAVTVLPGVATTQSSSAVTYYRNKVRATGADVSFLSVHSPVAVAGTSPLPSPQAATVGGTISWPGNLADKVLVRCGNGSIWDAQTTSDGRFAWIRTASGSVAEWILGEGTNLAHLGTALFGSTAPVVAAARGGRIDVTTVSPPASPLQFTAEVPFTVTEVTVDGAAVTFQQTGTRVTVGYGPSTPPVSDDRIYTFKGGFLWDGALYGNAYVTSDDRLTSPSGWAGIRVRNGQVMANRPVALGMDVAFLAGASGASAGFRIESAYGTSDVLSVDVAPSGTGSFTVSLYSGGVLAGGRSVPMDLGGAGGRFCLVWNPAQGSASIQDALGNTTSTALVPVYNAGFRVRAITTPLAKIDDITVFDSEEDGSTPQGVAFWCHPDGRLGCAIRTPQVMYAGQMTLYRNGIWLDPQTTLTWVMATSVCEHLAAPYLVPGVPIPATIGEIAFETLTPGTSPTPGSSNGLAINSLAGPQLFGVWTY